MAKKSRLPRKIKKKLKKQQFIELLIEHLINDPDMSKLFELYSEEETLISILLNKQFHEKN